MKYNFLMEKREYIVTSLVIKELSAEDLLNGSFNCEIKERMEKVISTEAPVRESIIYKRVINSYSLQKVGSRLKELFNSIKESLSEEKSVDLNNEEVFHNGENEDFFRPTPLGEVRYSYQIPYREASNCILYILENSEKNSYSKGELYRLFIKEMEWEKSGEQISLLFEAALKDGRIKRSKNGRIIK